MWCDVNKKLPEKYARSPLVVMFGTHHPTLAKTRPDADWSRLWREFMS